MLPEVHLCSFFYCMHMYFKLNSITWWLVICSSETTCARTATLGSLLSLPSFALLKLSISFLLLRRLCLKNAISSHGVPGWSTRMKVFISDEGRIGTPWFKPHTRPTRTVLLSKTQIWIECLHNLVEVITMLISSWSNLWVCATLYYAY